MVTNTKHSSLNVCFTNPHIKYDQLHVTNKKIYITTETKANESMYRELPSLPNLNVSRALK